jgi:hypothetical protein
MNSKIAEAWMFFDALMVEYTATWKANDCLLKISEIKRTKKIKIILMADN